MKRSVRKKVKPECAGNSRDWFRRAFTDDYLFVYSHRSESEAVSQVGVAIKYLPFVPGQRIIDIACGSGRHMLAFARLGARVTGVDLSTTLLKQARSRFVEAGIRATLKHSDMRELNYRNRFDGATMWFTSFGYFSTIADDYKVLKGLAVSLKPSGWWWIDIPNPAHLIPNLVLESRRTVKGPQGPVTIHEQRRIAGSRVIKTITMEDKRGTRSYEERVRLYRPEQFGTLVKRAGLAADGIMGDYDGSPFNPSNPRQIWYGRKL